MPSGPVSLQDAVGQKAKQLDQGGRIRAIDTLMHLITAKDIEAHPMLQSTSDPLSAIQINMGQTLDMQAAAAKSLLALSSWIDNEQRSPLMQQIERLRATREETLELSIAEGLKYFEPRTVAERYWLDTRLLLLLNASQPDVRKSAAFSLGDLIEKSELSFNSELLHAVLHITTSSSVKDRTGAAYVLSQALQTQGWSLEGLRQVLDRLRTDISYSVRSTAMAT